MWLQAVITADDLMHAFSELTPTRIQLDDQDPERVLELSPPSEVVFRANEGAVVKTGARLSWDLIGIKVPVTLRSVQVLLLPSIDQDAQANDHLILQARVEDLDLTALPGFADEKLKTRINEALERPSAFLRWGFTRTLDFRFQMPALVQPTRELRLAARWGALKVSEEGFVMAASFGFFARPTSALGAAPAP